MGKSLIVISMIDGEVNMKTKFENILSNELSELILNLEILTEDLRAMYRQTIKRKSLNKL